MVDGTGFVPGATSVHIVIANGSTIDLLPGDVAVDPTGVFARLRDAAVPRGLDRPR